MTPNFQRDWDRLTHAERRDEIDELYDDNNPLIQEIATELITEYSKKNWDKLPESFRSVLTKIDEENYGAETKHDKLNPPSEISKVVEKNFRRRQEAKAMKLYYWPSLYFLKHGRGSAFAIAQNKKQAIKAVLEDKGDILLEKELTKRKPQIYKKPFGKQIQGVH